MRLDENNTHPLLTRVTKEAQAADELTISLE
jgi:hypothetical protein